MLKATFYVIFKHCEAAFVFIGLKEVFLKVTNMLESFQVTHICGLLSILIGKYRVYIKVPFLLNFGAKIFLGKGFFSFGNIFENFFFQKNLLIYWIFVDKYSNFCSNYSAEYLAKTECTFGRTFGFIRLRSSTIRSINILNRSLDEQKA